MTVEQATTTFQMYPRTLKPLSKLRENWLQAFLLTLASPYSHTEQALAMWDCRYCQWMKKSILRDTKRAEKAVMGENYESGMVQEKTHGRSQWTKRKHLMENDC